MKKNKFSSVQRKLSSGHLVWIGTLRMTAETNGLFPSSKIDESRSLFSHQHKASVEELRYNLPQKGLRCGGDGVRIGSLQRNVFKSPPRRKIEQISPTLSSCNLLVCHRSASSDLVSDLRSCLSLSLCLELTAPYMYVSSGAVQITRRAVLRRPLRAP